MELWFLGTSAGMPIRERNVTSVVLRLTQCDGALWMFDCGEGTQHQLLKTPYKLSRLRKLFITHLHGDHVFGIPGLLSSRSSLGGHEPLEIYGPQGLRELIETTLRLTETNPEFPMQIKEITGGTVMEDDAMKVEAAELDHRIACFGYRVMEQPRKGVLKKDRLMEIGVPPGPLYGLLKAGEDVTLADGRIIRAADVVGPPTAGRVVTILGDTRPCAAATQLAENADMLVHEATFMRDLTDKAAEYGHSTTVQAAITARDAGAKRLLLTHFSSRYKPEDLTQLENEARRIFPRADAARELVRYEIPRLRQRESVR